VDKRTRNALLVLSVILAYGFCLRFHGLSQHGTNGDEVSCLMAATGIRDGSLRDVYNLPWLEDTLRSPRLDFDQTFYHKQNKLVNVFPANAQQDAGNGMAFDIILHLWIKSFGAADESVRFLTLVCTWLSILAVFWLARILSQSNAAGLAAALLLAAHPACIEQSHVLRSYGLAALGCVAATIALEKALKSERWYYWLIYGSTCALTLLSHYLTVYIFFVHGLRMLSTKNRSHWRSYLFALIVAGILLGAWMVPFGLKGMQLVSLQNERIAYYVEHPTPGYLWCKAVTPQSVKDGWDVLLHYISGTYIELPDGWQHMTPCFFWLIASILFAGMLLLTRKRSTRGPLFYLMALAISAPVSATILAIKSGHQTAFMSRYSFFSVPFFCAFYGCVLIGLDRAIANIDRKLLWITRPAMFVLLITVQLYSLPSAYIDSHLPNPYETLARTVRQVYKSGNLLILPTWYDAQRLNRYLPDKPSILQRVDATVGDKVLLLDQKGGETSDKGNVIFSFEGETYRY